jgi:DNA-binding CsgD family transcriptional regulator
VSNRSPVLNKVVTTTAPSGDARADSFLSLGSPAPALEDLGDQSQPATDTHTPPWQRDTGYCVIAKVTPARERQNLIKSLTALGQAGVILDDNHYVLEGTSGWVTTLQSLATMKLSGGQVRPVSSISQNDFTSAMAQARNSQIVSQVTVVLRDLDGWGRDIVKLLPVGEANPECVLVLIPKSSHAVAKVFEELGRRLGLSRSELAIGKLILLGELESEIAASLGLEILATRASVKTLLRKFRVRRASDLIALFARLP